MHITIGAERLHGDRIAALVSPFLCPPIGQAHRR
jgi:hypothetical protein